MGLPPSDRDGQGRIVAMMPPKMQLPPRMWDAELRVPLQPRRTESAQGGSIGVEISIENQGFRKVTRLQIDFHPD